MKFMMGEKLQRRRYVKKGPEQGVDLMYSNSPANSPESFNCYSNVIVSAIISEVMVPMTFCKFMRRSASRNGIMPLRVRTCPLRKRFL